jgi:ABC-type dipeptide/oligopeptide/nickel transport system permease component
MKEEQKHLDTLQDIKQIMDRSSRFISLSGLSGIAAGLCALGAVSYVWPIWNISLGSSIETSNPVLLILDAEQKASLLLTGVTCFICSFIFAIVFTWFRTKKTYASLWNSTVRRLVINTSIPFCAGAVLVVYLLNWNLTGLIAPVCLIFYGLALLNGSKYTVSEIRWLGISELLLGLITLGFLHYRLGNWIWIVAYHLWCTDVVEI